MHCESDNSEKTTRVNLNKSALILYLSVSTFVEITAALCYIKPCL